MGCPTHLLRRVPRLAERLHRRVPLKHGGAARRSDRKPHLRLEMGSIGGRLHRPRRPARRLLRLGGARGPPASMEAVSLGSGDQGHLPALELHQRLGCPSSDLQLACVLS